MEIFRLILSERHFHPSPNSGHGISGYSALLRVRLGGGAAYGGLWVEKPTIGGGFQPPDTEILFLGLSLYKKQIAFVLGLLLLVFLFRWVSWERTFGWSEPMGSWWRSSWQLRSGRQYDNQSLGSPFFHGPSLEKSLQSTGLLS